MKHVRIEIKFYNLDTYNKQIDVNFVDLDSNLVVLNYIVASLIFCHFWRSIGNGVIFLPGQVKVTAANGASHEQYDWVTKITPS